MDTKPTNPLTAHFRQPAIYIKLPSNGKWWGEDSLDMPPNGELPIYPMTSKDELLLRTPDALMNGSGVVGVIQSCCPNIKNAWLMPGVDVDTVLIAIRIASYGHKMDFNSTCPHCKEENEYALDLRVINDSIKCPDFNEPVDCGDLKISLKPQFYFTVNQSNQIRFEEQRILNLLTDDEMDTVARERMFNDSMQKLEKLTLDGITNSTAFIETADGNIVNDVNFIREFYENSASVITRLVQQKLDELAVVANVKPVNVNCESCHEPFNITMTFDYASFFDLGS